MSIHRDDELARLALDRLRQSHYYDAGGYRACDAMFVDMAETLLIELAERLEARRDAELTGRKP